MYMIDLLYTKTLFPVDESMFVCLTRDEERYLESLRVIPTERLAV